MEPRPTSELVEDSEHCNRKGIYSRDFHKIRLSPSQLLMRGIREGLTSARADYGQAAGEMCFELAGRPGIDSRQHDQHSEAVHIASIADIISSALRKKQPWKTVGETDIGDGCLWETDAFLDPSEACLRRIVCVTSWSDERHYSLCRSWGTLGTMCIHEMPMKIGVAILGAHRDGRYHGFWSKGVLHPANRKVRFRKKGDGKFKESWIPIWREDRGEISTSEWLEAMLRDGVLQDSLTLVEVPLPEGVVRKEIVKLARRKISAIYETHILPDKNLSTCDWPYRCSFLGPCHSDQEPSGRFGFIRVDDLG